MGEQGMVWYDEVGEKRCCLACASPEKVIDTNGAGDIFTAPIYRTWRAPPPAESHASPAPRQLISVQYLALKKPAGARRGQRDGGAVPEVRLAPFERLAAGPSLWNLTGEGPRDAAPG